MNDELQQVVLSLIQTVNDLKDAIKNLTEKVNKLEYTESMNHQQNQNFQKQAEITLEDTFNMISQVKSQTEETLEDYFNMINNLKRQIEETSSNLDIVGIVTKALLQTSSLTSNET